jgi:hypothetical protein
MNCPHDGMQLVAGACVKCGYGTSPTLTRRRPRVRPHKAAATSTVAYHGLTHGQIQREYRLILEALDDAPAGLTRRELSQVTPLGYEAVCGRVDELLGKRNSPYRNTPLVAEMGTRKNDTGIRAKVVVRAGTVQAQESLL